MNTTKDSPHGANRKTAIIVGVLYIVGTLAGILSLVVTVPVLESPDFLVQVSADPSQMVTGALLVLTMGLALALMSVMMFPILKGYNEALALGYVLLRGALETMMYLALVIGWLALPLIGREYIEASPADASSFQSLGDLMLNVQDQVSHVLTIVFILGALMFYYVLFRSRLVPRWLAGWGLLAAIPYFLSGVFGLFSILHPMSSLQMMFVLPLALQEMVLAVWLIVRGFHSSPINIGTVNLAVSQS